MKFVYPESPAEFAEFLADPKRVSEAVKEGGFKGLADAYAKNFNKKDGGEVERQAQDMADRVLKKMYEENNTTQPDGDVRKARLPFAEGDGGGGSSPSNGQDHEVYKRLRLKQWQMRQVAAHGVGPSMDGSGLFAAFKDWAQAISPHVTKLPVDLNMVKVLGEAQGDQGGFLVPEEFRVELLRMSLETAVVRTRARVLPMSGLTARIPAIRDTTHATNVYGGVQGYWTPESGSFTQTDPTFAQVVLTAKKLMGGTRLSNELLRDSAITLEPLINDLFGDALAYFEDDAFIAGIGGGQPLGILNADALVSVAKETGQAATTLLVENIIKAYARMLPSSINRAVWVMNPDVQAQLYTMSLSVGTGGAPMFFPAGGISGSPSATLLGRPIVLTEKAETLGTAGDVYFVDFSYYLIGDRMALEMASSPYGRFLTDETDFRFIQRVDGRPWIDSALTPRNGSDTLSPFMAIAARA
tara:strand:- start:9583 stop:10992 length:1410 start_codon:yes stop_codon:yes gene_type:complete